MRGAVTAWNRWPVFRDQTVVRLCDRDAPLPPLQGPFIAHGNGRSYSDVCLNEGGFLLDTRALDRFISFDRETGRICCEAGVLLADLVRLTVPQGWFLPVTPGTLQVSVGGAIANDVHGKNHHVAGSFGRHVVKLALRRSDGDLKICGPDVQPEWFAATVGGLGLTGVILWAEIQLLPIEGDVMVLESRRFRSLDEFWSINDEASGNWPYTVAWLDCLARPGSSLGRGWMHCGRHAPATDARVAAPGRPHRIGFDLPVSLVNRASARAFNALYYLAPRPAGPAACHYQPYFYPLDRIVDWNRLYGPSGFLQYQCVLPPSSSRPALPVIVRRIATSGEPAFLGVLKTFGDFPAAGLLSFARPGATLAVDFPNRGGRTMRLFQDLDDIVLGAGGALYPAKDARMPARMFRAGYARIEEFTGYLDPMMSSSFWRRVSG
jgi:FAD/FMN-containing dehydrogenase